MSPAGSGWCSRKPLLDRCFVPVAEAADGLDRGTRRCVRVELSPKVADVELHLVAGGGQRVTPDELAKLVVAQYLVRVADEGGQQAIFEARQSNLTILVAHGTLSEGDAEPRVSVRVALTAAARAAKEHIDPRNQLLAPERLDDVVVRSTPQPPDAFQLRVTRGQHKDGHVRHLPDPLKRGPAVESGHRDVEDH